MNRRELLSIQGRPVQAPVIPETWNREDKPYVALLVDSPTGNGDPERIFITRLEFNLDRSERPLLLTLDPDRLPEGSLLEVMRRSRKRNFRGGKRQRKQEVYRKDQDGWKLIAERYLDRPVSREAKKFWARWREVD